MGQFLPFTHKTLAQGKHSTEFKFLNNLQKIKVLFSPVRQAGMTLGSPTLIWMQRGNLGVPGKLLNPLGVQFPQRSQGYLSKYLWCTRLFTELHERMNLIKHSDLLFLSFQCQRLDSGSTCLS